jgi:hypothetical protein
MSMIQDVTAEDLARLFHHYHHALAQDCVSREKDDESTPWESTPPSERRLMVAAARLALLELAATPAESTSGRKYYAKPGEAEWGC